MAQTRKKYDKEFKKNAVRLSYASNKTVMQTAQDLDISDGAVQVAAEIHAGWGQEPGRNDGRGAKGAEAGECPVENGAGHAKKGKRLLCEPPQVIYSFMDERTDYPVVKWAEFFEVSTSGYYIWKSQCTARQRWEEQYRHSVRKAFESGEDPCNSFLGDWEKGTGDNVYLNEMLKQVIHTIKYRNNMKVIDIDITYR